MDYPTPPLAPADPVEDVPRREGGSGGGRVLGEGDGLEMFEDG